MTKTQTAKATATRTRTATSAQRPLEADPKAEPYIDHSVYPDLDTLPDTLETDAAKADYMDRICGAWDFDVFPEPETIAIFRTWKPIFDRYPLPHSPAYHTFRRLYGWEDVPFPLQTSPRTLYYEALDRREGRGPDPCEHMI